MNSEYYSTHVLNLTIRYALIGGSSLDVSHTITKGEDKISLNYNRGILGVTIQLYFPNVEFANKAYLIAKHRISSGLSDCLCVCVWGLSMWTLDSLRKTFITF